MIFSGHSSQTPPGPPLYDLTVPKHLKRYYGAGDLHFITCSCYQRRPWLGSALRRDLFLTVLEHVRQRYGVVILGYVIMPEHFHLLISEPQYGTPSVVMQAVKLGFARRLLHAQRRKRQPNLWEDAAPSHVWQRRFYDFNVWTERKRIEKLRYMHQNPVKRGLAGAPDQWRWSSFRAYAHGEIAVVRINDLWCAQADDSRREVLSSCRPPGPTSRQPREKWGTHIEFGLSLSRARCGPPASSLWPILPAPFAQFRPARPGDAAVRRLPGTGGYGWRSVRWRE
jgi:putative transposase